MNIEIPGTEILDAAIKHKQKQQKAKQQERLQKNLKRIINTLKGGLFTVPNCGSEEVCKEIIKIFSAKGWKVEMFETSHMAKYSNKSNRPVSKTMRHLRFSKAETNDNTKRSANTKTGKKTSKTVKSSKV